MPLLMKLEDFETDPGSSLVSKKEPALFKELMQLMRNDETDPETLQSLLDALKKDLKDSDSEKEGNVKPELPFDRILSSHGSKPEAEKEVSAQKHPALSEPKLSGQVAIGQKIADIPSLQPQSAPLSVESGPEISAADRFRHAHILSRAFLEQSVKEQEIVHDFRASKDLKELIRTADRYGLRPVGVEIENLNSKTENLIPEIKKMPLPSASLLQRAEHISKSAAAIVQQTKRPETGLHLKSKTVQKSRNDISTLQQLLSKPEEKHTRTEKHNISESGRDVDLLKLLSGLQRTVPTKSQTHIDENSLKAAAAQQPQPSSRQNETLPDMNEAAEFGGGEHKIRAAEHLNQKIIDAKVTVRHFAQTLQEQIENYKPPFTRMQISLDPKDLGSVDVTLVSRGNNLHIQVNSNPTAIGVMATQGNELKNQLVSMGFTDVQMQFSMNQQQQGRQQWQSSGARYVESEEIPDFYESLELIIPRYV